MPPRPNSTTERDIGALQATVAMLAETMKEQAALQERMMHQQTEQYNRAVAEFRLMLSSANADIEKLRNVITDMKSTVDQAKGGWKVLVGVGTISATVSAVLTKIASAVWFTPR